MCGLHLQNEMKKSNNILKKPVIQCSILGAACHSLSQDLFERHLVLDVRTKRKHWRNDSLSKLGNWSTLTWAAILTRNIKGTFFKRHNFFGKWDHPTIRHKKCLNCIPNTVTASTKETCTPKSERTLKVYTDIGLECRIAHSCSSSTVKVRST